MGFPPLNIKDSAGNGINPATSKMKFPYGSLYKGTDGTVNILQPLLKNRLTIPGDGRLNSVTGITQGTYAVTVLADGTNHWMTSQSSGVEPDLGQRVRVTSTVSVPTGLAAGTDYWVVANVKDSGSGGIKVAASQGGTAIAFSDAGSGTVKVIPMDRPFSCTSANRPASSSATITVNSSSPVSQTADIKIARAGLMGDYVAFPFTIDQSEKGQMLTVEFKYILGTVAASDQTVGVWVNDLTNNKLIPVTPSNLFFSNQVATEFVGVFQSPSNSTSFELVLFSGANNGNTITTSDNLNINEIFVHRKSLPRGPAITDWTSYTPTFQGFGTPTSVNCWYKRDGSDLLIEGKFVAGTTTAVEARIGLPSGLTSDTTYYPSIREVGHAIRDAGATSVMWASLMDTGGLTYINLGNSGNGSGNEATKIASTVGALGTGEGVQFNARIKIAGWSSNQVLSSSEDGRVCSASMYAASNLTGLAPNNTYVKVPFDTATFDSHGQFDVVNKRYAALNPGYFEVTASVILASTNVLANQYRMALYKNGVLYGTMSTATPAVTTVFALSGSIMISLLAGDYVEIFLFGAGNNSASTLTATGGATFSNWNVTRQTGPAQIAASESVNCAFNASATSISGALATVVWTNKDFDSHSGMASGLYTVPAAGKYEVVADLAFSGTFALNTTSIMEIQLNSVAKKNKTCYAGGAITNSEVGIAHTMNCLAGDVIRVQASCGATGAAIVASTTKNAISITRLGN